jgi:methylphosphotriester-DNA--protein-cysteine methyltransferase
MTRRRAADVGPIGPTPTTTADDVRCPGCGSSNVPAGRVFCRPSCRAKHEHREAQRNPRLFPREITSESEL